MNCQSTLEILVASDEQDSGWESACLHLAGCAACQREFQQGTPFDRRLAELCRAVIVPVGLEQRLLGQLAVTVVARSATSAASIPSTPAGSLTVERSAPASASVLSRRLPRRRMLAAVAVLLCGGVSVAGYLAWDASQRVTLEQFMQTAAGDLPDSDSLPAFKRFSKRVALQLPQSLRVELDEASAKRVAVGPQVAAVFFFPVRTEQGDVVTGRLLVLPRQSVSNPPVWEGFSAESVDYVNRACVWREGDLIYVCHLEANVEDLYRLFPPQQAG